MLLAKASLSHHAAGTPTLTNPHLMKTLLTLANSLALSAPVLTTQAQAPATSHNNPTPAKPAPTTGKGTPKVVGSKNLGRKMVEKSKPTDMLVPPPPPARPVKK